MNKQKRLAKNTIMLYILQISTQVFSFATSIYQTRIIAPDVMGNLAFALAISVYFQLFIDFGFLLSATQDVANSGKDKGMLSRILTSVTSAKLLFSAISIGFVVMLVLFIPRFQEDPALFLLYTLLAVLNALMPDFIYRGLEEMTAITVRSVCIRLFFTVCIFVFLRKESQYLLIPLFSVVGALLALVLAYAHIYKKLDIRLIKIPFSEVKDRIRISGSYFVSRIASTVYGATNTFLLGIVFPNHPSVGLYTMADKVVVTARNGLSPISDSMYPYMVRNKDFKLVKRILLIVMPIIAVGCGIVFYWAEPLTVLVFSEKYAGTGQILRALIPVVLFTLPNYILGFPTLSAMGLSKYANYSVLFGTGAHIVSILTLFATGNFTVLNLAIVTSVTEGLILLFRCIVIALNWKNFKKNEGREEDEREVDTAPQTGEKSPIKKAKHFVWRVARRLAFIVFRAIPLNDKRVVISSYYGKGYGDNPKSIVDHLALYFIDLDVVWLVEDDKANNDLPEGIRAVKIESLKSIFLQCTAILWIDNCRKWSFVKKRRGQTYVQTWHGGVALKKIEQDAEAALNEEYVYSAKRDAAMTDVMISNSTFCTEMYERAFWYNGPVLEYGSPRNDVLYQNPKQLIKKVYSRFGIEKDDKVFLYAPTFRKDHSLRAYDLDFERVRKALSEKFGGNWTVLIRLHPNITDKANELDFYSKYVRNASYYENMQELLAVSDILCTDYSSSMFDFGGTLKPCFLYASDLESYEDDRGFYFKIEELPFPLAMSNAEMVGRIEKFEDDKYKQELKEFNDSLGIVDDGYAGKKTAKFILGCIY